MFLDVTSLVKTTSKLARLYVFTLQYSRHPALYFGQTCNHLSVFFLQKREQFTSIHQSSFFQTIISNAVVSLVNIGHYTNQIVEEKKEIKNCFFSYYNSS